MSDDLLEVTKFIDNNKKPVKDALGDLVSGHKFVLVGEHHYPEMEPIRREIIESLEFLKSKGLTQVAFEVDSSKQGLIGSLTADDPNLSEYIRSLRLNFGGWFDGNNDMIAESIRLGLKVVFIDTLKFGDEVNGVVANFRDRHMAETLVGSTRSRDKTLVFIGSSHVTKGDGRTYHDGYKFIRLAKHLVNEYGDSEVVSVRHVGAEESFNGLIILNGIKPHDIRGSSEIVILPDDGPVEGDKRVTASDYIITQLGE